MSEKFYWFCIGAVMVIIVLFSQKLQAQVYVGADIGRAYQYGIGDYNPDYSACSSHNMDRRSTVGDAFIGYRYKYIGVEGGSGSLFHSWFYGTCGASQGSQTIDASYRYFRMNAYLPVGKFDLVPFVGKAHVKFTNFEDVYSSAYPDGHGTNYTTAAQTSLLYGLGLQRSYGHWLGRIEYQRVNHAAEDYWTARYWHNNIQTIKLGLGYQF